MRIIEVGPRDGLQNERVSIPTEVKADFVEALVEAGLGEIEVTSFVSPKWVPQLGDAPELLSMLRDRKLDQKTKLSALVPNPKGLERALEAGIERIALFTAASEAFTLKNINMSIAESLATFRQVAGEFKNANPGGFIRGYVSTAFECPFSGPVEPSEVRRVVDALLDLGVDEISIGDTIGVATPLEVRRLTIDLLEILDEERFVYHFHDTRGTAVANVAAAVEMGISAFDSSAAGLGGCPYAPGAGGNLATDDLAYFFERQGIATGIDRTKLAQASLGVLRVLDRAPMAKAQQAELATSGSQ